MSTISKEREREEEERQWEMTSFVHREPETALPYMLLLEQELMPRAWGTTCLRDGDTKASWGS